MEILQAALADQAVVDAVTALRPQAVDPRHRPRLSGLLLEATGSPDGDSAARASIALADWGAWLDARGTQVLAALVADLSRTTVWRDALEALVRTCSAHEDGAPLLALGDRMLGQLGEEREHRDQPARQRLHALAGATAARAGWDAPLRPAAAELADRLSGTAAGRAVELAAACVPWGSDDGQVVAALARVAAYADRPSLLPVARDAVLAGLRPLRARLAPGHLQAVVQACSAEESAAQRLLGLAVLRLAGRAEGWSEPWVALLRPLREDPDPDVRAGALETFTTAE